MLDEVFSADNLDALEGVRHAFFTKAWGGAGFAEHGMLQDALLIRARMAGHLRVAPERFLFCRQMHSPNVVTVGDVWTAQNSPKADAIVTDQSGIALGVLTADCVPVLLASSNMPVIGAAHAGWRGALCGVLEHTVEAMEKLGASRQSLYAALGPCIGQESYEVGAEFPAAFLAESPSHDKFFKPAFKSDHYLFDLSGYVEAKLRGLGITSITMPPADTCAEPDRFFSYRYSTLRTEERLVSAIALA